MSSAVVEMAKKALANEMFSSALYSRLAALYGGSISSKLAEIAEMERKHTGFWAEFLRKRGCGMVSVKADGLKLALYVLMFRVMGLGFTLRILELGEQEAVELYSEVLESPELDNGEREALREILKDELVHEQEFVEEASRFKELLSHIRDAVLGMNDGLVEVLSATAGLAGVYGSPFYMALGGLIVGVAGALSMGLGAFTSVRAQRQVHESVFRRIGLASRYVAHVFKSRLVDRLLHKGYSRRLSEMMAEESSRDHRLLSRVVAEEEYGLKAETMENPFKSGLYTGLFYVLGALIPLLPYFIGLPVALAVLSSLLLAGVALAFTGFMIAVSAGLAVRVKMVEMVAAGLGSAGLTYAMGRALSLILGVEVG